MPGLGIADDGTLFSANIPAVRGRTLQADLSERLGREVLTLTVLPCPKPGMRNSLTILWYWRYSRHRRWQGAYSRRESGYRA
ncbi:N-acetyl-D-glucosamine kinase [Erwinia amylovora Ea644]|nr:N-acetyl-D-glucosamine kinase [Erwinia amylovora Ea644]CCP06965.1 hypothetical protein BN440_1939 [Erwinia amylovora MR1]